MKVLPCLIQMQNASVKISKDSVPYSPSISIFMSKQFSLSGFVDLVIAPNSQIKAWRTSVKVSKHSDSWNPSIFPFISESFFVKWIYWLGNRGSQTDQGLSYIGEALQGLISLQSINFEFRECYKITDQGVKSLSEGLKRLSSLQSVAIEVPK